jgi:6-pyruvoyltetrahydropterin/6-carboxytetrahydropterin synthase
MFEVTREIDFCYGHRLLNYEGKCRYLHGHNGRALITVAADTLDDRGMVQDFSDIKKSVGGWIDHNLDHRMLLNRADPVIAYFEEIKEPLYLLDENPTAENIAKLIYDFAISESIPVTQVQLWETPKSFAVYRG